MKHIIRYGTLGDHADFIELAETYDMIVINANAITHSQDSIVNFLIRNICVRENKDYYIDPITYAFQDHLELLHSKIGKEKDEQRKAYAQNKQEMLNRPIKPTFDKLINIYGDVLAGIRDHIPLQAQQFLLETAESELIEFCNNIMNFQKRVVQNVAEKNDIKKYLEYDNVEINKSLQPKFVIAPYFYMDIGQYQEWLAVNIKMYEICQISNSEDIEVRIEIFIDRDMLQDRGVLKRVAERYIETECDGYILWIDSFDETRASKMEIDNLLFFLELFRGKSVYSAYGGFFSILLGNDDVKLLDGVSHGLEYGENRGGFPVGGGMPASKYYFLPLHRRLRYSESLELLERQGYINTNEYLWGSSYTYLKEICRCKICRQLMPEYMEGFDQFRSTGMYDIDYLGHTQRRTIATRDEKTKCRRHYMYCKKVEFNYVKNRKLNIILQDLAGNKEKYKEFLPTGEKIEIMDVWIEALKHMGEK